MVLGTLADLPVIPLTRAVGLELNGREPALGRSWIQFLAPPGKDGENQY